MKKLVRMRECEMNVGEPVVVRLNGTLDRTEFVECGKPATYSVDHLGETYYLCEEHTDKWSRDVDDGSRPEAVTP